MGAFRRRGVAIADARTATQVPGKVYSTKGCGRVENHGEERVGIVKDGGLRLDRALVGLFPDLSRARLQDLVRAGQVSRDGGVVRDPSLKIAAGTRLVLDLPPPSDPVPEAEAVDLVIAYEMTT